MEKYVGVSEGYSIICNRDEWNYLFAHIQNIDILKKYWYVKCIAHSASYLFLWKVFDIKN